LRGRIPDLGWSQGPRPGSPLPPAVGRRKNLKEPGKGEGRVDGHKRMAKKGGDEIEEPSVSCTRRPSPRESTVSDRMGWRHIKEKNPGGNRGGCYTSQPSGKRRKKTAVLWS